MRFSWLSIIIFVSISLGLSGCEEETETFPAKVATSIESTTQTDGTNTETTDPIITSLVVTAVDPYVEEAQFCLDTNDNGSCDEGTDPFSTTGTEPGQYVFNNYTPDKERAILTVKPGLHNGKAYALNLKGTVLADSSTAVITPASTLAADKGITAAEITTILNQFSTQLGTVISEADLTKDPLEGALKSDHAELSTANIARLRFQMTLYALQRILQSTQTLRDLNGTALIASATLGDADGDSEDKLYSIMEKFVEGTESAVDTGGISAFLNDTAYTNIPSHVRPDFTVEDFTSTAMTLIDHITELGYKESSSRAGNLTAILDIISPELVHIKSRTTQIAKRYFASNHQADFSEDTKQNRDILSSMKDDSHMKEGLDCTSKHFEITTDSKMKCVGADTVTTLP